MRWPSLCFIAAVCLGQGEDTPSAEAVLPSGATMQGWFRPGAKGWEFLSRGDKLVVPVSALHEVRFAGSQGTLPKARLLHRLLLARTESLVGELVELNEKQVRFLTSWGQPITVPRAQVCGIEQPRDVLTVALEDFEDPPQDWALSGASLATEHVFAGKKSLRVQGGQAAIWKLSARLAQGRLSACFFQEDAAAAEVTCSFEGDKAIRIKLGRLYEVDQAGAAFLTGSRGWHLLQVEFSTESVRVLVDDRVLTARRGAWALSGLRVAGLPATGPSWFDSVHLARRDPAPPHPPSTGQDEVWLAEGDQVFGSIVQADARGLVVQGRFGKNVYAWSQARGAYFAAKQAAPTGARDVQLWLTVGFGMPPDRLLGKLLAMGKETLELEHSILGKIAFPRKRLEKVAASR